MLECRTVSFSLTNTRICFEMFGFDIARNRATFAVFVLKRDFVSEKFPISRGCESFPLSPFNFNGGCGSSNFRAQLAAQVEREVGELSIDGKFSPVS